jgi:hypothetical protein
MSRPASAFVALASAVVVLAGPAAPRALAAPGDTTWVASFQQEFINWATPHYAQFEFPAEPADWQKVVARLTIECPGSPDDCDPWDRLGHLRVVTPDQGDVEIARFVTPYDITGGSYPGSCSWNHNVTPWKSLLQDTVELRLYVESWIGGNDGWLITIDFAFIEGEADLEPYRVVRLFGDDHLLYGDPDDPIELQMPAVDLDIPTDTDAVEVRVFATGHGQGNYENCAEFCRKSHLLYADDATWSHFLWRSNCSSNPCSPQGGTWQFSRAGWCPGAGAPPWVVDLTGSVQPGSTVSVRYDVEPYENFCRPTNPDCVDGQTCPVCAYNGGGHTPPHYTVQASAILYRDRADVVTVDLSGVREGDGLALGASRPNPFSPRTRFDYTVPRPGRVQLLVYDTAGRIVVDEWREHATAGTYSFPWDGRDRSGSPVAAGVYFYSVRMDGESRSRKMIRVR